MAHHVLDLRCWCHSCAGTGIYVGFAERDGAGVVCHACKGTGCEKRTIEWDDFEARQLRSNVARVFEVNPGIGIGKTHGHGLDGFGGMPYTDWSAGEPFPAGSEMRAFTCPAWWYQTADHTRRPYWDECGGPGGLFARCPSFTTKAACWDRWDTEQVDGKGAGNG
jgi:hypothetical protein